MMLEISLDDRMQMTDTLYDQLPTINTDAFNYLRPLINLTQQTSSVVRQLQWLWDRLYKIEKKVWCQSSHVNGGGKI